MFLDVKIKVPRIPGRITRQVVRGVTYINYQYDRVYDKARKFNIPKRATIGKLTEDGLMIPNENFHKFLPELNLPGERPRAFRSSCLRVGVWMVLRKLLADYRLPEHLGILFRSDDLGLLLDLAAYSIVTENNVGQYYPDYAYNHPLFTSGMRMYSDSKVSSFLNGVTEDQTNGFLDAWNASRGPQDKIYISYDSTNKNCQAGDLAMVEFGKAKDDLRLPVFNYAIAYDRANRVPLFYEKYAGSIVDVSQLRWMLEKAQGYGYRNAAFILDRGYFSKANIAQMDAMGYDFVLMVKGMGALVRELVKERRGTFEASRDCAIREYRAYGTTVQRPLYAGDARSRWLHVFHSSAREAAERECVERKLEQLARHLEKMEGTKTVFSDIVKHYFILQYAKDGETFLYARERKEVVEEELCLCGYFVIVTSEEMTARDALMLYKSRDDSEKLFRGDKSYLGDRAVRVYSDESVSAKIFVEFVALILRNKLYTCLKPAVLKNNRKANYMTVPAAVRELEKIEMVRRTDNVYRLDHAVTATQKAILAAFGLDEGFIHEQARELGEKLSRLDRLAMKSTVNGKEE